VLLLQSKNLISRSVRVKLDDRWFGPHRIREIPPDSTFYKLEELDGMHLKATFAGDQLKHFFSHSILDEDRIERRDAIRVRDSLEALEGMTPIAGDTEENLDVEGDELE